MISSDAGGQIRAPEIVTLGKSKLVRYVSLPKQMELQQINWETVGLESAQLPKEIVVDPIVKESHLAYRGGVGEIQATLREAAKATSRPSVELAETHILLDFRWVLLWRYFVLI